jgi:hypothetical protein
MAVIQSILAKVLIQVGADEPKEIGTIEIPIEVGVPQKTSAISYPPGVRAAEAAVSYSVR